MKGEIGQEKHGPFFNIVNVPPVPVTANINL